VSDGTVGGDVGAAVERERERGGYYLVSDGTVGGDVGAVERERERWILPGVRRDSRRKRGRGREREVDTVTAIVYASVSAVMCGNIAQRVNSLCFSLRSLLFHTVHSKSDNCHAALLSFSLISLCTH